MCDEHAPPPSRAAWRAFGADAATKCLGIPVGGAAPRADAFSALCARAGADLELLSADGAPAYGLLRFCAGAPRLVHGLRALEASEVSHGCQLVDAAIEAALGRVAGVGCPPPFASLPLRMGGCGTIATDALAPAARLAGRLAIALGDDPWPLEPESDEGDWCSCGGARQAPTCRHQRCPLCCAGDAVCPPCAEHLIAAARALSDPAWGWLDAAALGWLATTSVPPHLVRGFVALAGARPQPQRALHQATMQRVRASLLATASPFIARRLESNATVAARAIYTFAGIASSPLSPAAFAYGLRLRLAHPGAALTAPVPCECVSAAAGRRDARRLLFRDAPGDIAARAHDWHARACKSGPLARGAHQTVAAAISLFLAQRGIVSRWEAGGTIPEHGRRRCDVLALLPFGATAIDIARCDVETGTTSRSGWRLLSQREHAKIAAYSGLLPGVTFTPLVVDEVGRLGPASTKAVCQMAAAIESIVDAEPGSVRAELFATITAAVIDGQFAQLVSRGGLITPTHPRWDFAELTGEEPIPSPAAQPPDLASSGVPSDSEPDVSTVPRLLGELLAAPRPGPHSRQAPACRRVARETFRRGGHLPSLLPEGGALAPPCGRGRGARGRTPRGGASGRGRAPSAAGRGGRAPPSRRPPPAPLGPHAPSVAERTLPRHAPAPSRLVCASPPRPPPPSPGAAPVPPPDRLPPAFPAPGIEFPLPWRPPVPAVLSSARTPAPPLPVFSAQCSPGSPGERRMGAGRAGGRGALAPGRT